MTKLHHTFLKHDLSFVLLMGVLSRGVILLAMWGIAPFLAVPEGSVPPEIGFQSFAWWDGEWYLEIATQGYSYAEDGQQHSVAFFPLFPLLIRLVMTVGISPTVAGTLINNLAFFGALWLLFVWVKSRYGGSIARWTVVALAWCPYSLYGTTVYTEGLFLFLTTATLWTFEQRNYTQASLWGFLATVTRPPGVAMIPGFFWTAWRKRLSWQAYGVCGAIALGILLFMAYCGWQFGEPLAFVKIQETWGRSRSFDIADWWRILMYVVIGVPNYDAGYIKDWTHPLLVTLIFMLGGLLWQLRQQMGAISSYGGVVLVVMFWLIGGDPFLTLCMVWGGLYLLWRTRHQLTL
ncbi:MAG: hypothetical protein F6K03_13755, partial [Kamptonema sp. SIO4C4]|nr:hypothetical protein [Kamptonema sp. SIO4C4]